MPDERRSFCLDCDQRKPTAHLIIRYQAAHLGEYCLEA
jgi:hypothetical protein